MRKVLSQKFFNRDTKQVAQELLGKFLVKKRGKKEIRGMITEVEVYDGFKDKVSKGSRGQTVGNAPMFGPPGHWYVYFTYGMHWMLNIVTREKGYPAAILIRAISTRTDLVEGPARLTKAFVVDKKFNTKPSSEKTGLWIEDRGVKISPKQIKKTPRIGIPNAGSWVKKPLRFLLKE